MRRRHGPLRRPLRSPRCRARQARSTRRAAIACACCARPGWRSALSIAAGARRVRRRHARDLGDAERFGQRGGHRLGRRLAAAGHARTRRPSTQISFLGGAGHEGLERARRRARAAARTPACCAPTRRAPARASCRASRSAPARRSPCTRSASAAARRSRTSFTIAHQAPVSQKQFPLNPGDAARGPALQLGADADALDGHDHDAGQARRRAGRPVPRALPGQGHAGPDDRRPGRQPGLVQAAAGRRRRRRTSRSSSTEGKPVLTWWQGRDARGRLRPGRDRDLQHAPTSTSPRSGRATATTPTCTRST